MRDRPTPTDAERLELLDRLWNDPRRRADRHDFTECESCGAAVRWVANLGSRFGSSIQIVARPVATAAVFDREAHQGLVAVFTDGTGFTVGRGDSRDDLEDALLYRCHWDVCDHARRVRDERSRALRHRPERVRADELEPDPDVVRRYQAWRREQG